MSGVPDRSPSNSPPPPTDAPAPFHANSLGADLILRAAGNIDFRVNRAVVTLASPILHELIGIPQPSRAYEENTADYRDGLPVVQMSEDSRTLEICLQACYPSNEYSFDTLDEVRLVLEAGRKYEIKAIMPPARDALLKFLSAHAVSVYCIACRYEIEDIARKAAAATLQQPEVDLKAPELDIITGTEYLRLLLYHRKCATAAYSVSKGVRVPLLNCLEMPVSFSWAAASTTSAERIWFTCDKCADTTSGRKVSIDNEFISKKGKKTSLGPQARDAAGWWWMYMQQAGDALRLRPCGASVKEVKLVDGALEQALKCEGAHGVAVVKEMREFSEIFAAEVDRVTREVQLELKF